MAGMKIEEFKKVLNKVLEYEGCCEGRIEGVKIEKEISYGMSKGLIGYLYMRLPRKIEKGEIERLLRKGEWIECGYKIFKKEGEEVKSFTVCRRTKNGTENLLSVDENKIKTFVLEDRKERINSRSLEIILDYLKSNY